MEGRVFAVIRMATAADAAEIVSIYSPFVLESAVTFDCEVPSVEVYAEKIASTLELFPFLIAEDGGRAAGYAYASRFKPRAAYDWAVETTVYVRSGMEGRGVGSALYAALERILARQNITNLNACITYPNPASMAFHENQGYKTVAHFTKCGFKLGRWWDMIWMEKFIGEHACPPPPFIPLKNIL